MALRASRLLGAIARAVVVGAGFDGLKAARELARAPVEVTVIDSASV